MLATFTTPEPETFSVPVPCSPTMSAVPVPAWLKVPPETLSWPTLVINRAIETKLGEDTVPPLKFQVPAPCTPMRKSPAALVTVPPD